MQSIAVGPSPGVGGIESKSHGLTVCQTLALVGISEWRKSRDRWRSGLASGRGLRLERPSLAIQPRSGEPGVFRALAVGGSHSPEE